MRNIKVWVLSLLIVFTLTGTNMSFAVESRPSKWAAPSVDIALARKGIGSRLYSEYQSNITRGDFAYLGVETYEELTGIKATVGSAKFTDTLDEYVLKAKNLGIVDGYLDGTYKPDNFITREELASLMVNLMEACNLTYNKSAIGAKFVDVDENDWAYSGIMIAKNNEVVKGISESEFSPKGNATREAAIAMYVNLVEKFDKFYGTVTFNFTEAYEDDYFNQKLGIPEGFTIKEKNTSIPIYVPKNTPGMYANVSAVKWEPNRAVGLAFKMVLKNKNVSTDMSRMKIVREWTQTDLDNVFKALQQPELKLIDFRKEDIMTLINYSETHLYVDGSLGDIDSNGYCGRLLIYDNSTIDFTMDPASQDFCIEVYQNSDLNSANGFPVHTGSDTWKYEKMSDIIGQKYTTDLRSR